MTFIWPWMLVSLLLLPVCVLLYAQAHRRRRDLIARWGSLDLTQSGSSRRVGWRRHCRQASPCWVSRCCSLHCPALTCR
ncbi:MAG: hypothetical protein HC802_00515 [Caldilineaceae bacterium]|nr:hypothetical protein [Caldilineaceae bacterium]